MRQQLREMGLGLHFTSLYFYFLFEFLVKNRLSLPDLGFSPPPLVGIQGPPRITVLKYFQGFVWNQENFLLGSTEMEMC